MTYLGTTGNQRLRTVAEGPIIDLLLQGGWAYELREGDRQAATAATRAALAGWEKAGLPVSSGADGRGRYDPVEVLNFMKWTARENGDRFWPDRYQPTGRKLVLDQGSDRISPGQFAGLPSRDFSVVLTRRFNLSSFKPGTPLRLRLPLPLEGTALTNLKCSFRADFDAAVEYRQSPGRLEARFKAPNDPQVAITSCADFQLKAGHLPESGPTTTERLDANAAELYTDVIEGFVCVSSRILGLSGELAAKCQNPRETISSFWDYLMDHLRCGAIHYHEIDPILPMDWVLDNGWYDCHLGSALLVSLCRARRIPARIVGGHMLYPLAPCNHYWAEVWLEGSGWTPYDLALSWDLSDGGRERTWRNCFAGTLDYRMKTQCFPRTFTGPMSVRVPPRWHILNAPLSSGIRVTLADSETGAFVYRDDVAVTMGPAARPESILPN